MHATPQTGIRPGSGVKSVSSGGRAQLWPRRMVAYREAFEQANVGMALIDGEGNFIEVNQAVAELFGYSAAEMRGMNLQELWLPAERRKSKAEFKRTLKGKQQKGVHERAYRKKSGAQLTAEISWSIIRERGGELKYTIASFRDTTEINRVNAVLVEQASTDLLTGALNRGRMEERAGFELIRADRYREKVSLVMIDVDRFKRVNDHYGHNIGDRVLRGVCDIARCCLRATDLLGRWGGDEFVALLPGTGIHGAEQLAERLRASMESTRLEKSLKVTVSMGVATYREGDSLNHLMMRADAALYRAKQTGRNRVMVDVEDLEREMTVGGVTPTLMSQQEIGAGLGGDTLVGAEHREIFRLANLLIMVASQDKGRSFAPALISELMRQLETHLAAEERVLEASGYPWNQEHHESHQMLTKRLRDLLSESKTSSDDPEQVRGEVRDEVSRHMLMADRKYLTWLQSQQG